MSDSEHLVPFLFRADWTRWSIGGTVVIGRSPWAGPPGPARFSYRFVIAPGGRYRYEPIRDPAAAGRAPEGEISLAVSDGQTCWVIRDDEGDAYRAEPLRTPMDEVIRPSWLLSRLRLVRLGSTTHASGRAAVRVRGVPRQSAGVADPAELPPDRVELLIDSELGLVLAMESFVAGRSLATLELRDLTVHPPESAAAASFEPPAGIDIDDCGLPADFGSDHEALRHDLGLAWALHGTPVGLAAAAARVVGGYLARQEPTDGSGADDEAVMPAAEARPRGHDQPSDALLNLIARAGLAPLHLTAQAHRWSDQGASNRAMPATFRGTIELKDEVSVGFFGYPIRALRPVSSHRSASLRVTMPDRYRIEYHSDDRRRPPLAMACDGRRLRKAYHNRIVASPAEPLPPEYVRLLDPVWLLSGWRLAVAGHETVHGRGCVTIVAEPLTRVATAGEDESASALHVVVWLDEQLGIVLRQVSYVGDQAAVRFELRDVSVRGSDEPGDFDIAAPAGIPVLETDGGPVHDLDLPPPVIAAADAASTVLGGLCSGLIRLTGEISRRRSGAT